MKITQKAGATYDGMHNFLVVVNGYMNLAEKIIFHLKKEGERPWSWYMANQNYFELNKRKFLTGQVVVLTKEYITKKYVVEKFLGQEFWLF